jgi:DNA-binding response OmpR family regulator
VGVAGSKTRGYMNYKLLLADDSIAIQKVVELMLSDENITLLIADNGEKALEITQKEMPDIVFIDADISKLDGYEFCKALRSDENLKSIPVVLLVAAFGSFDDKRAAEIGVASYLSKPFLAEELMAKIKEVTERTEEVSVTDESLIQDSDESITSESKEKDAAFEQLDFSDKSSEKSDKARTVEEEGEIPLESISLEEEIKKAQEKIDLSHFDADELASSLKDELNERLPDKEEILEVVRETTQTSVKENIESIKTDILEEVKQSLTSSFAEHAEVQKLIEDAVKENLGPIIKDIKDGMSEKAKESMNSLVVEKDDIIAALSHSARESFHSLSEISPADVSPVLESVLKEKLEQVVDGMKAEISQKVKESCEIVVEKDDIIAALSNSARESFHSLSEISPADVSPVLESVLKEKLEQIAAGLKEELTHKVNESCQAVVIEENKITDALREGAQESLKHILSPSGYDMAEALKNSLGSMAFAQEASLNVVRDSAYSALVDILNDLVPEIKENLISSVMHDSLVDSMKEVIKTVAWEVIPEIASKIITDEISKIKESL